MKILLARFILLLAAVCTTAPAQSVPLAQATYALQPGDSFEVNYRYTPEYNQTVTVQPDGFASLTLIGNVRVGGYTLERARAVIQQQVSKRLKDPEVAIVLKDFERPHFTVMGEVGTPGRYELRGPLTAVDGLAIAGGLKVSAKHTQIILIHRLDETTGEAQLLDFKALEKDKDHNDFPPLRNGDLIIVPQSKLSKIERLVKLTNVGIYYPL